MKVAIYIRVSRSDLNLDNQRKPLVDYANMKGWDYRIFEEQESTRKTRPVKEELLSELRKGKYDGVIVYKLDRWARSLQELIMNVDEITNRGKFFISVTQPFDTSGSMGRLTLQILGAMAEFEREMIRERTMAGLDRARAQGKTLGRPRKRQVIKQGGFSYKLEENK